MGRRPAAYAKGDGGGSQAGSQRSGKSASSWASGTEGAGAIGGVRTALESVRTAIFGIALVAIKDTSRATKWQVFDLCIENFFILAMPLGMCYWGLPLTETDPTPWGGPYVEFGRFLHEWLRFDGIWWTWGRFTGLWACVVAVVWLAAINACYVGYAFSTHSFRLKFPLRYLRVFGHVFPKCVYIPFLVVLIEVLDCPIPSRGPAAHYSFPGAVTCWTPSHYLYAGVSIATLFVFLLLTYCYGLFFYETDPYNRAALSARGQARSELGNLTAMFVAQNVIAYTDLDMFYSGLFSFLAVAVATWTVVAFYPFYRLWMNGLRVAGYSAFLWICLCMMIEGHYDDRLHAAISAGAWYSVVLGGIIPCAAAGYWGTVAYYRTRLCTGRAYGVPLERAWHVEVATRFVHEDEGPSSLELAESIYRRGLALFPYSAAVRVCYGAFLLRHTENKQQANSWFEEARKHDPFLDLQFRCFRAEQERLQEVQSVGTAAAAGRWQNASEALINHLEFQKNTTGARRYHRGAVRAFRKFWSLLLSEDVTLPKLEAAVAHIDRNETRAQEHYKALLAIQPNNPRILRSYGKFHEEVLKDSEGAQGLFDAADEYEESTAAQQRGDKHLLDADLESEVEEERSVRGGLSGAIAKARQPPPVPERGSEAAPLPAPERSLEAAPPPAKPWKLASSGSMRVVGFGRASVQPFSSSLPADALDDREAGPGQPRAQAEDQRRARAEEPGRRASEQRSSIRLLEASIGLDADLYIAEADWQASVLLGAPAEKLVGARIADFLPSFAPGELEELGEFEGRPMEVVSLAGARSGALVSCAQAAGAGSYRVTIRMAPAEFEGPGPGAPGAISSMPAPARAPDRQPAADLAIKPRSLARSASAAKTTQWLVSLGPAAEAPPARLQPAKPPSGTSLPSRKKSVQMEIGLGLSVGRVPVAAAAEDQSETVRSNEATGAGAEDADVDGMRSLDRKMHGGDGDSRRGSVSGGKWARKLQRLKRRVAANGGDDASIRRLQLTSRAVAVVLIAMAATCYATMSKLLDVYHDGVSRVGSSGSRRFLAVSLATYGRMFALASIPGWDDAGALEAHARAQIKSFGDTLEKTHLSLAEADGGDVMDVEHIKVDGRSEEDAGGGLVDRTVPVWDAVFETMDASRRLLAWPSSAAFRAVYPDPETNDDFYVLTQDLPDLYQSLLDVTDAESDRAAANFVVIRAFLVAMFCCATVLCFVLAVFFFRPTINAVRREKENLLKLFFDIPRDILHLILDKGSQGRSQSDDEEDEDFDDDDDSVFGGEAVSKKGGKAAGGGEREAAARGLAEEVAASGKSREEILKARKLHRIFVKGRPRFTPISVRYTAAFLALFAVFFVWFVYAYAMSDTCAHFTVERNYGGLRKSLSRLVFYYAQELIVGQTGIFGSIHQADYEHDRGALADAIDRLENVHRWIAYSNGSVGLPGDAGRSPESSRLQFGVACSQDRAACSAVQNGNGFARYLSYYILRARMLAATPRELLTPSNKHYSELRAAAETSLNDELTAANALLETEASAALDAYGRVQQQMLILTVGVVAAAYLVAFQTTITSVRDDARRTMFMLLMIPPEVLETVDSVRQCLVQKAAAAVSQ